MSVMDFSQYSNFKKDAYNTIMREPVKGIPTWRPHIMEHSILERIAGVSPGDYVKDPLNVYLKAQRNIRSDVIDQFIPENPLSMDEYGYIGGIGATTGSEEVTMDGMPIRSPEDVVAHMESFVFPRIKREIAAFDETSHVDKVVEGEWKTQQLFRCDFLKTGYGFCPFPIIRYGTYGYVPYFCAYALYPEIMERDFMLQSELAFLKNKAIAEAWHTYHMPLLYRADHDMMDARDTLVDIKSMEKIWFPYFASCFKPIINAGITVIWHCDGNIMPMVPYILECGIEGFQGFQYEDGVDYVKLCKMKPKSGKDLFIVGGVSVTRTLPLSTPEDVKKEIRFLVENGPKTGLMLGLSSSMVPGVKWENVKTFIEGLNHYRTAGR